MNISTSPVDSLIFQYQVQTLGNGLSHFETINGQRKVTTAKIAPVLPVLSKREQNQGATENDVECIDGIYYRFDESTMEASIFCYDYIDENGRYCVIPNDLSKVNNVLPPEVIHKGRSYVVTTIKEGAFNCCGHGGELILPSSLRTIEFHAFSGASIQKIRIPDNVESIGYECFSGSEIESLWIGDGVSELPFGLLHACFHLSELHLGAKVRKIDTALWYSYHRDEFPVPLLEKIEVSADNPYLCSIDGIVCSADGTHLVKYPPGRQSFQIPSSIKTFEASVFSGCVIKEVVLPQSMDSIPGGLFFGAWNLEKVVLPDNLVCVGASAFNGTSIHEVTFPETLRRIEGRAFSNCLLTEVNIPDNVDYIADSSFGQNPYLKKVHVGKGVRGIPDNANSVPGGHAVDSFRNPFAGCENLETIEVDEDNPWLSSYNGMLYDKSQRILFSAKGIQPKLVATDFAPTLSQIGKHAFSELRNLQEVEFPESASIFDEYIFSECDCLQRVTFLTHAPAFATAPFYMCHALKDICFRAYYPFADLADVEPGAFPYEDSSLFYTVSDDCVIHVPVGMKDAYFAKMGDKFRPVVDDQPMAEGRMDWDYSFGYHDYLGARSSEFAWLMNQTPYEAGILVPKEQMAGYKGCRITSVQFKTFTPDTQHEIYAFIAKGVGGERIRTQYQLHRDPIGWNTIHFQEPYLITGEEDVFIGVGLPQGGSFNLSGYPVEDHVMWIDDGIDDAQWFDFNKLGIDSEKGAPCIAFTLEGEDIPANIKLCGSLILQEDEAGSTFLTGSVESTTVGLAKGYELSYRIDGSATQSCHVADELAAKQLYGFRIPVRQVEKGKHEVELWCSGVDGRVDGIGADSHFKNDIMLRLFPETYTRKVVVEEGTGTWCGWCPRGIVGIQTMQEKYPDTFIPIAIHTNDEMSDENSFYMEFSAYPMCVMDRKLDFDPTAETLEQNYLKEAQGADAKIELQAQWIDKDYHQVSIQTTTRFGYDMDENYLIAYVVSENQVGPFLQTNYYAGGGNGTMGGFEKEASKVNLLHNHVSRFISDYGGTAGTIVDYPLGQTDYEYDYVLDMPDNIQNVQNIELTVLIINQETGEIMNADRIAFDKVKPFDASGIANYSHRSDTNNHLYYNLYGMRIKHPANRGIYIQNGRKIHVR